jgi:hypothetical protein
MKERKEHELINRKFMNCVSSNIESQFISRSYLVNEVQAALATKIFVDHVQALGGVRGRPDP